MSDENLTEYAGWDDASAAADTEAATETTGGQFTYFKAEEGRNVLRFVPPAKATGRKAMYVTHQHYVEQPGRPKVVFNCPVAMKTGGRCPVCEKAAKLRATGNQLDRDTAFGLSSRMRVYACVVDRKHPEKGVQVYGFGKTVMKGLKSLKDDPDVGDFFRPDTDGYDVIVERTGTGKNDTEYAVRPAVKNSPLAALPSADPKAPPVQDVAACSAIIGVAPDLTMLARVPSTEEIVARLKGDDEAVKAIRARERAALPAGNQQRGALPANAPPWEDIPPAPDAGY